jgi:intein/homing endonuclease
MISGVYNNKLTVKETQVQEKPKDFIFDQKLKGYLGDIKLKRANQNIDWTPELLQEYVKCSEDPIYFVERYIKIINVNNGLQKFQLYEYQKNMLRSFHVNRNTIVLAARQSGKSISVCAYILWYILFNAEQTVALLANDGKVAREMLGRIQFSYEYLPKWLQQGILEWNKGSLELENNSRVIAAATTKKSVRGFAINLLYIDETAFIENWEEFSASVMPTISSGKHSKIILSSCVTKDTYIFTSDGPKQISDLIDLTQIEHPNLGYEVSPYKVLGKDKIHDGSFMVNSGTTETYKIKTQSTEVECSYKHKFWVCDKNGIYSFKKAKDIEVDEWIALRYGMNLWGNNDNIEDLQKKIFNKKIENFFIVPDKIDIDLAYFFGLFLSEGYADKKRGRIVISCGDDISSSLTNLGLRFCKYDNVHYNICSRSFFNFLEGFGFDISKKAKDKTIPKRLFQCSETVICAFLRGFFDGDGCISGDRGNISVASSSEKLINQIRILLLNLGIFTQKYYRRTKPTKKVKVESDVWTLEICAYEQQKLYMEKIGFGLERKRNKFKKNKPYKGITKDYIPFGRKHFKTPKNGVHKTNEHISRKEALSLGIQHEIVDKNIKWDTVKKIDISENKVYDFTLPDIEGDKWCHSIIYNGAVGFQTPYGLNHFHALWVNARMGINNYTPISVNWRQVPGRDERWKEDTLSTINHDIQKFEAEYECVDGSTIITLRDKDTGEILNIPINSLFYKYL